MIIFSSLMIIVLIIDIIRGEATPETTSSRNTIWDDSAAANINIIRRLKRFLSSSSSPATFDLRSFSSVSRDERKRGFLLTLDTLRRTKFIITRNLVLHPEAASEERIFLFFETQLQNFLFESWNLLLYHLHHHHSHLHPLMSCSSLNSVRGRYAPKEFKKSETRPTVVDRKITLTQFSEAWFTGFFPDHLVFHDILL